MTGCLCVTMLLVMVHEVLKQMCAVPFVYKYRVNYTSTKYDNDFIGFLSLFPVKMTYYLLK